MTARALVLLDGEVAGHGRTSLRIVGSRIASIGEPPRASDLVIELAGDRVLPGLINSHDHLQLNNFPRLKFRATYGSANEWIADVAQRREHDDRLTRPEGVARDARLRHGGIKNLLAGVTTVAHHDPDYPAMRVTDFPVRVLSDYGWAHSLGVDGEERVRESHRATGADRPWFIHAGEGVDAHSRAEFAGLESLGCLTANARFIHGVAFSGAELRRLVAARAGLVWCPGSNLYLFGRTAEVTELAAAGRVALGSDSRLSGSSDLLEELRVAHATTLLPEQHLESLVTHAAADLLGLPDRGRVAAGALADLLILPRAMPLWAARRADLRGVMLGGSFVCGDPQYLQQIRAAEYARIMLDGREKLLTTALARDLADGDITEPGVSALRETGRAA